MGCSGSKAVSKEMDSSKGSSKSTRSGKGTNPLDASERIAKMQNHRREATLTRKKTAHVITNLVHEEFNRDINDVYDMKGSKPIGKGAFGTVRVVTRKNTDRKFALKAIPLAGINERAYTNLLTEVDVMSHLDHPNIVRLQEVYQDPGNLYLVMDLCTGGELIDRYKDQTEDGAAHIIRTILSALRYCHDNRIAHRDIKLENILYEDKTPDSELKLVDFGLGGVFEDQALQHDIVGSWTYMAPEVLQEKGHDPFAADIWAVGVLTHELLLGRPPVIATTISDLRYKILFEPYIFKDEVWDKFSPEARSFVRCLLCRDPKRRCTAAEAQKHPWVARQRAGGKDYQLGADVTANLRAHKRRNLLTRVTLEMLARSGNSEQFKELEKAFKRVDVEGKGVIGLLDFHKIMISSGLLDPTEAAEVFSSLDLSGSGTVCFTEFLAAAQGRQQLDERRLRMAFDRMDVRNCGVLTAEDLQHTFGADATPQELAAIIADFDRDSDGVVTFQDFCEGMRRTSITIDTITMVESAPSAQNLLLKDGDNGKNGESGGPASGSHLPLSRDVRESSLPEHTSAIGGVAGRAPRRVRGSVFLPHAAVAAADVHALPGPSDVAPQRRKSTMSDTSNGKHTRVDLSKIF